VVVLRPEIATIKQMAAHGLTRKQIAEALGVSRSTVQRRLAEARGSHQEALTTQQVAAM
jgi:DNA-binding transcriptional regulator LsrR (DeoR family)